MENTGQSIKYIMIAGVLGLLPVLASHATAKPLKVFIMAGQSNMQGWTSADTFDYMADDPKTAPILKEIRMPDGKPRVCQKVWISSIGCAGNEQTGKVTFGFGAQQDRMGPEFTFAIYMEKVLGEPMLLIKTSWGGKSLRTDFRPPGAGPCALNDNELAQFKQKPEDLEKCQAEKAKATGVYYRLMVEHVKMVVKDIKRVVPEYDPKQGYELAGFLWFQGWNDFCDDGGYPNKMKPGGYDEYSHLLAQFIRDVRKDLAAPKMPFVIGVMGIGGLKGDAQPPMSIFRQAMAAPAALTEFQGNVVAVRTAPFWDDSLDELHARWDRTSPKVDEELNEELKKNPKMTQATKDELRKKVMAEYFSPQEVRRLSGISHWDCHYHGAAKIIAPIGKAFAEAMVQLQKNQPKKP